ncbi:putative WD40/YVTN repeat-like-containing domain, WD40 repeat-like-containing domain protein [Pseudoloma neurophilia]|uniref:Putative WD40/YVTN repeat-like-containing domain, WD40 repeat-like-containing domain protein n=1 Tax=Pseudoloma neurophilia TaxID=146866 RepID=A0A0R0M0I1_9MICR|nr:putative WD40/YVTN repeat-like-containing domain, WD40 repeat-like-containing domain protein [Pseudoloma neurophilia]
MMTFFLEKRPLEFHFIRPFHHMKSFRSFNFPDKPLCLLPFEDIFVFSLANGQIATFDGKKFNFIFDNRQITIGCLAKYDYFLIAGDWKGNLLLFLSEKPVLSRNFKLMDKFFIDDHLIKALETFKHMIFVSLSTKLYIFKIENQKFVLETFLNLENKILCFYKLKNWLFMGMSVPALYAINLEKEKMTLLELECTQVAGILAIYADDEIQNEKIKILNAITQINIKNGEIFTNQEKLDYQLPNSLFTTSADHTIYRNNEKYLICDDMCRKIDKYYYTDGNKLISRKDDTVLTEFKREICDFCIFNSSLVVAGLDCTIKIEQKEDFEDELAELKQLL